MDKEKFNERICRIIWHDALQNSIKPFLWSIDFRSIKVIDNGTEFMFQNHKKTGKVIIQHSERTELFNVTVIHDNDEKKQTFYQLPGSRLAYEPHRLIYCKGDYGDIHDIHDADS